MLTATGAALCAVATAASAPQASAAPGVNPPPLRVLAWGDNTYGELGDGQRHSSCNEATKALAPADCSDYPVAVTLPVAPVAIAAGSDASFAVLDDGTVWSWGWDGEGPQSSCFRAPCAPIEGTGQLGTGREPSLCPVLTSDGEAWLRWHCSRTPVQVMKADPAGPGGLSPLTGIVAISAGYGYALALDRAHRVWAWGFDSSGQLGLGDRRGDDPRCDCRRAAVEIPSLANVTAIAAGTQWTPGGSTSLAVVASPGDSATRTVWAWGDNTYGQLGQGTACDGYFDNRGPCWSAAPLQVRDPSGQTPFSGVTQIAAGRQMVALRNDGTVWAWGGSAGVNDGTLGNCIMQETCSSASLPEQVLAPTGAGYFSGAVRLASGWGAEMVIKDDNSVWEWFGSCCPRPVLNSDASAPLQPVSTVSSSGQNDGVALDGVALQADGTLWGWGDDSYGELANEIEPTCCQVYPHQANGVSGATAVASGSTFTLAIAPAPPPAPPPRKNPAGPPPPPAGPAQQPPLQPVTPNHPGPAAAPNPGGQPGVATTVQPANSVKPPPPGGGGAPGGAQAPVTAHAPSSSVATGVQQGTVSQAGHISASAASAQVPGSAPLPGSAPVLGVGTQSAPFAGAQIQRDSAEDYGMVAAAGMDDAAAVWLVLAISGFAVAAALGGLSGLRSGRRRPRDAVAWAWASCGPSPPPTAPHDHTSP